MTRVVSTGKESGNNFEPDNGTGAQVRTAIKDIFGALRTLNAGSGDPSGTSNVAAYQPHIDTNTNLLKISDRAVVLANKKIIAQGTPKDLINNEQAKSFYFGETFNIN